MTQTKVSNDPKMTQLETATVLTSAVKNTCKNPKIQKNHIQLHAKMSRELHVKTLKYKKNYIQLHAMMSRELL